MILSWNEIDDYKNPYGGQVFRGVMESPATEWESTLPDLTSLGKSLVADPALSGSFGDPRLGEIGKVLAQQILPIQKFIGELVMHDFIVGMRQTLSQTVQTVGILSEAFNTLQTIFTTNVDVASAFNIVDSVLDSKIFEMALNAIGAIPIVGWIIRAVYEIAKSVVSMISTIKDQNLASAEYIMAKKLTIAPEAVQFSPDTDDTQTRAFFKAIGKSGYDPLKVITPSYNLSGTWQADGVGDPLKKHVGLGWVVKNESVTGGIGFVPGSMNITRSLFLPCRGQGIDFFKDIGSLYPTASNQCTGWWSGINKPGPSMFSIAPLAAKGMWETYIEKMFVMCQGVLKGWTFSTAANEFTDKFVCESGLYGTGDCKKSTRSKTLKIPSDAGRDAHTVLYGYLAQLFFGVENPYKANLGKLNQIPHNGYIDNPMYSYENDRGVPFWKPGNINYGESVPSRALDDLYNRQLGTLASLQCMYVNGEDRSAFPAFNNANLRKAWSQGVTDVFSSGAWRRVVFQDMPEGSAKDAFAQHAKKNGIKDIETWNRPCAPGEPLSKCRNSFIGSTLTAGYQMPSAPSLPAPPMNDVVLRAAIAREALPKRARKGSGKSGSSALPLILAAGAIGLLLSKK